MKQYSPNLNNIITTYLCIYNDSQPWLWLGQRAPSRQFQTCSIVQFAMAHLQLMHPVKFRSRVKGPGLGFGLRVESLFGFCIVVALVYYGAFVFFKTKIPHCDRLVQANQTWLFSHPNIGSNNFYFLVLLVFGFCKVWIDYVNVWCDDKFCPLHTYLL